MRVAPAAPWGMMPSVDRTAITPELVSRLVGAQFPQWAGLAVRRVEPGGWDNITFRLGPEMSVRLPSGPGYAGQVDKEHRWLPGFAGQLPLPIPVPLAYYTFGGWKRSGFGDLNQHGPDAIRFYTKTKTVTSRWPSGIKEGAEFVIPTMK